MISLGADLFEMMRRSASGVVLALLFPMTGLAADNWLEKVFPDPEECLEVDGMIYFDFDEKELVVRGYQKAEVHKHIATRDVIVREECKAGAGIASPLINKPGKFFGNQFSTFEIPASGQSSDGCFTASSYNILFSKPAAVLREEIERRTGKRLEIYSPSRRRDGSAGEMPGYIVDAGDHSEYVCSFSEYD
ncbi:hypothetical protein Rleg4DRAFT_4603 [Rhizobium leguminosarum bv. trifolii WSM2297]|uniref:Uncharacterized protein n=1 Tax=Rhizobium leguminosarum bv. trifolii WSM2297 TaxID=754762 RepID=J0WCE0_RHILT|nr:hypothetical protein [Rhizobium leguminosarum]EJC82873.1 hypothetical protein Rleg4DRAFT_4603 [Rhizobium leguminosarum bv. trifolii WSM2297]